MTQDNVIFEGGLGMFDLIFCAIWKGNFLFFQKSPYLCLLAFLMPSIACPMLIHAFGTPCKQYKNKRCKDERLNSVLWTNNLKLELQELLLCS